VLETAGERVWLEARRHGVSLVRPFLRSAGFGAAGAALLVLGWPFTAGAAPVLVLAALTSLAAVWQWERTRIVLTTEKLLVVSGTLRRRATAVPLSRVGAVEVEQTLPGRLLGYGTLVAGHVEIAYVPKPRRIYGLVERVCAS
jgi:uncharacterized membrane protein YdbT with pleckstrin-like domain